MRGVFILLLVFLLIIGAVYGLGTNNVDRRSVAELDLERYMGDWYEVARYDHSFERGLVEVRASYTLRDDGTVDVCNSGKMLRSDRLKTAHGKAHTTSVAGRLRVSFCWFFYSDYNVMELGKNYEWALVGSSSSKYLWILARTPQLPARTLNSILRMAERRGYPSEKLLFIDQPVRRNG